MPSRARMRLPRAVDLSVRRDRVLLLVGKPAKGGDHGVLPVGAEALGDNPPIDKTTQARLSLLACVR